MNDGEFFSHFLPLVLKFSKSEPLICISGSRSSATARQPKDAIVKIDPTIDKTDTDLSALKTQQKRVGDGNAAAQGAESKSAAVSDQVRLSPQYQALAKAVSTSTSFNADKVASIKAAIAKGEFTVDAGKIADGVLATAKELINTRQRAA
jgi:negative regulator of flagellin synthesis FlgM